MVLILGIIAILFCLAFLVWFTVVKRGGAFKTSEGAKKIYIVPPAHSAIVDDGYSMARKLHRSFRAQAVVSSVGDKVIDFRCMTSKPLTIAEVAYIKTLLYALLPLGLVLLSVVTWRVCGKRLVDPSKVRPMMVGTIVLMLYLIYPSVATSVLGLWKCEHIEQVGSIFVVDPQTLCTDTVHTQWVHGWQFLLLCCMYLDCPQLQYIFF